MSYSSEQFEFTITPYDQKYEDEVRNLVGKLLVYTGAVEESSLPIDDDDLDNIPGVYGGRGGFWLAMKDSQLIGTVGLKDMGNDVVKLKRMFVLPEYHGKLVGLALLKYALRHAKEQGFLRIELNTSEKMKRAHHFYEKHGFVRTGQVGDKIHYEMRI